MKIIFSISPYCIFSFIGVIFLSIDPTIVDDELNRAAHITEVTAFVGRYLLKMLQREEQQRKEQRKVLRLVV